METLMNDDFVLKIEQLFWKYSRNGYNVKYNFCYENLTDSRLCGVSYVINNKAGVVMIDGINEDNEFIDKLDDSILTSLISSDDDKVITTLKRLMVSTFNGPTLIDSKLKDGKDSIRFFDYRGNEVYYENGNSWERRVFDHNNNELLYEDSNGFTLIREFDGDTIISEEIIDNGITIQSTNKSIIEVGIDLSEISSKIEEIFKKYIDEGYNVSHRFISGGFNNLQLSGISYKINRITGSIGIADILEDNDITNKIEEISSRLEHSITKTIDFCNRIR